MTSFRPLAWLKDRVETRTLVSIIGVCALAWGFGVLSDEVAEKATMGLDQRLLLALRAPGNPSDPIGSRSFEESMRDVTALGGVTVLTLVTTVAVVSLLFYRRWRQALVLGATVMLADLSGELLKLAFGRERPTLVPHGSYVYSASFPSGHSTVSAATWLTIAAVLATLERRPGPRLFFFVLAGAITIAVGFSRVYLGVHWPTDVLAGWTLGAAWALLARIALAAWRGDQRPAN